MYQRSAWYDGEDDLKKYWSITVYPEDIGNKFYKTKEMAERGRE